MVDGPQRDSPWHAPAPTRWDRAPSPLPGPASLPSSRSVHRERPCPGAGAGPYLSFSRFEDLDAGICRGKAWGDRGAGWLPPHGTVSATPNAKGCPRSPAGQVGEAKPILGTAVQAGPLHGVDDVPQELVRILLVPEVEMPGDLYRGKQTSSHWQRGVHPSLHTSHHYLPVPIPSCPKGRSWQVKKISALQNLPTAPPPVLKAAASSERPEALNPAHLTE